MLYAMLRRCRDQHPRRHHPCSRAAAYASPRPAGNAETDDLDDGKGTMEALYFGTSTGWAHGQA